ncbi:unnamed protein product [Chrysoparadoxa australica]
MAEAGGIKGREKSYGAIEKLDKGDVEESTYLLKDPNEDTPASKFCERFIMLAVIVVISVALLLVFMGLQPAKPSVSNVYDSRCENNAQCYALGVRGQCCPTDNGIMLGCCATSPAACASNPACANAHIQGDCCPTKAGDYLRCIVATSPRTSLLIAC